MMHLCLTYLCRARAALRMLCGVVVVVVFLFFIIIRAHHMHGVPLATHVAWSVCVSVCLALQKLKEPIEMPFSLLTAVGPPNHVLGEILDPPMGIRNFGGCSPNCCFQ